MIVDNSTRKVNLSETRKGDIVFAVIGSTTTNDLQTVYGEIVNYAIRPIEETDLVFLDAVIDTGNGITVQSNRVYKIDVNSIPEKEMDEENTGELTLLDVYPHHDTLLSTLEKEYDRYIYRDRAHMTKGERIAWQIDYKRRKEGANKRAFNRVAEFLDLVATLNAEHPFETA